MESAVMSRSPCDAALSMFAWAHVREKYQLTCFGSSMGDGYGPKIVGRAGAGSLTDPDTLIAVPGIRTTAFLMLTLMLGDAAVTVRHVETPFDRILESVASGKRGVTHGLLIHQSQLTFADLGLELLADVGAWWLEQTRLPLPLGGNAVRRDLDSRFGAGATQEVVDLLDHSIRYALEHRERSLEYCMRFAPELDRRQAERYIEMYVNDLTVDAGPRGQAAIQTLLDRAAAGGFCPPVGTAELLRPTGPAHPANSSPRENPIRR
jgi:1,4-dihydroxy-6-naphthoate synthase